MDPLEVEIEDREDPGYQLRRSYGSYASASRRSSSRYHEPAFHRKRRASPSPERAHDDHIPREDIPGDYYDSRYSRYNEYPHKNKFRRTHNRFEDRRNHRREDIEPQRKFQETYNLEHVRNRRCRYDTITILDCFDQAKEDILTLTDSLAVIGDALQPVFITFESCVSAFTIKTGAYASVVGIFMAKGMTELAEKITQHIVQRFGSSITAGNRIMAIHFLRFLIGIHSANVRCCKVMEIIESLIQHAKALEQATYTSQQDLVHATFTSDNLMYIVAASLPWFSTDEFQSNREALQAFCEEISQYNTRRNEKIANVNKDREAAHKADELSNDQLTNPYAYLEAYRESRDIIAYKDRLSSLSEGIKSLLAHEWSNSTTYRFYQSKGIKEHIFENTQEPSVSQETRSTTNEAIETIKNVDPLTIRNFSPVPVFNISFSKTEEDLDGITLHDKWLLEEHILHTVHTFEDDTTLCSRQLLLLPHNSHYREFAIVETLFNVMLSPLYNNHFTLFAVMVMQKMSESEDKISKLFEKFYSELTDNMEHLDSSVICCLIDAGAYWFSVEFCKIRKPAKKPSNNETTQSAMDVEGNVNVSEEIKQQLKERNQELFSIMFKHNSNHAINFNNRLLDKISRLIYADRLLNYSPDDLKESIRAVVQQPMHSIQHALMSKPIEQKVFVELVHFQKVDSEEKNKINYKIIKFIKEHVNKEPLKQIPSNIFTDEPVDVTMAEVSTTETCDNTIGEGNTKLWMEYELILIFWETLLLLGNKSVTHLMRLLDTHGDVMRHFVSQDSYVTFEESLIYKVLRLSGEFLRHESKKLELLVDALFRANLLRADEACKFAFTDFPNQDFFSNKTLWIIKAAVDVENRALQSERALYVESLDAKEEHLKKIEEQEIKLQSLLMCIAEQVNNKLSQCVTLELEMFLENMFKNIILSTRNSVTLFPLLSEAQKHGYHPRVLMALQVSLSSQHVTPLY